MNVKFVLKFSGCFGFLKPWTAVRDSETFSQQFLTPSILEGIEKKLFPELLTQKGLQNFIVGHRLNYTGISRQQEQTWSKAWIEKKGEPIIEQRLVKKKSIEEWKEIKIPTVTRRPATGILIRGVLIEPNLYLAFSKEEYALQAAQQHICLCRNEDVMLPDEEAEKVSDDVWYSEAFPGFELLMPENTNARFKVGYNRFNEVSPMYGEIKSYGDPIRKRTDYL